MIVETLILIILSFILLYFINKCSQLQEIIDKQKKETNNSLRIGGYQVCGQMLEKFDEAKTAEEFCTWFYNVTSDTERFENEFFTKVIDNEKV